VDTDIFKAIQVAAVAAFEGPMDHIDYCNKLYVERRDIAVRRWKDLGWDVVPNKGTFYMWLRVPPGMTSQEFSGMMLDRVGIAVPPGTAYGPCGEGFFRMSLCVPTERLKEAFDRMEKSSINFNMAKATVNAG
jgi:LL-diaminopimelate aminotransferase